MVGAIDSASLAILISIGHQTGLFDAMADLPPSTSAQIAQAAGLNERYVREGSAAWWSAGSSTTTPRRTRTFSRATRRGANSRGRPRQPRRGRAVHSLLAEVEQKIIGCFRAGGGLSYSEYPRFHALMAETSGEQFDAALIDVILPMAKGLPERLRAGANVADFGCGSGHAVNVHGTGVSGPAASLASTSPRRAWPQESRGRPPRPDQRSVRRARRGRAGHRRGL